MIISIDLKAETERVDRYYRDWAIERDMRDRMIAECSASHNSPPENYWKPEREARRRFEQAAFILEALLNADGKAPLT